MRIWRPCCGHQNDSEAYGLTASSRHLWQSLGFQIIGTVPAFFDHPEHGLVGLHVMFRHL
jgi:hypothetical protein